METYEFKIYTRGDGSHIVLNLTEDKLEQKHIDLLAGELINSFNNLPKKSQEIVKHVINAE